MPLAIKTHQSTLYFHDDKVEKHYHQNKINRLSSVKHESEIIEQFNGNAVKIHDIKENSYTMERLDLALGNTVALDPEAVRRVLFTLTLFEIERQLDKLLSDLESSGIRHNDINPGNILYSEQDRTLKLADFYWASKDRIKPRCYPSGLNSVYGMDDKAAIELIKNQIREVADCVREECADLHNYFKLNIGNVNRDGYFDGSSLTTGKAYHIVDHPYFKPRIPHHKTACEQEYKVIKESLPCRPKRMLEVGCANGYFAFNFMRDFRLNRYLAFEADPHANHFIRQMKRTFSLIEFELKGAFDDSPEAIDIDHDIALCLNVHMWVYKQLGAGRTLNAMRNLINRCKWLYFQTTAADGSSMYVVKELKDDKDIAEMLKQAGAKSVDKLQTTVAHHGKRHLFLVGGNA